MAPKRSYEDGCASAHALDVVGERWALLVVRELLLGPKRFTDLRAGLPGISPNVLTQRLGELRQAGVVVRRRLPPPMSVRIYELTPWGEDLRTVITALGRWGLRSPALPTLARSPLSWDSRVLSLYALFRSRATAGRSFTAVVSLAGAAFTIQVDDCLLDLRRGAAPDPDVTLHTDDEMFEGLLRGTVRLADAVAAGRLRVSGDLSVAELLPAAFPLT
ncbi:hypothetical protein ALI22I_15080 [Saccharothrix sp. ALI-22-I]|uniref:winged helix-turn-helix transcriptional regulator n=1 Tax=Saccharothrix sp. ALI-22-I TaxID=1933778 RepID=UPI00097C9076|nr:winged helix-turn-helix transcriptional regulator [Saccharothrix sp. ALI-22-I]ONI89797.1 hypothetical protein ALI22I_15080 [Saccharothrix sp. ALI-22-I]